jgi:hypothetical protein
MSKWAVYDTFSGEFTTFDNEEEARKDFKEVTDNIRDEAMSFESVYIMEVKESRHID